MCSEMCLRWTNVGGMENLLRLIERQRERKANRSHNSSGSDVHDGSTFTVGLFNTTHNVDKGHRTSRSSVEVQVPKQGATYSGSDGRLQAHADAADETAAVNHVRHRVDEPVVSRSEANSVWKKDDLPKVIPRKVASVPVSSHPGINFLVQNGVCARHVCPMLCYASCYRLVSLN